MKEKLKEKVTMGNKIIELSEFIKECQNIHQNIRATIRG